MMASSDLESISYHRCRLLSGNHPSRFVVRPSFFEHKFRTVNENLNSYFQDCPSSTGVPSIRDVLTCHYEEGPGDVPYYRVTVVDIIDSTEAVVSFADFGVDEFVPVTSLYHMPEELKTIPPLAVICELDNWTNIRDQGNEQNKKFENFFKSDDVVLVGFIGNPKNKNYDEILRVDIINGKSLSSSFKFAIRNRPELKMSSGQDTAENDGLDIEEDIVTPELSEDDEQSEDPIAEKFNPTDRIQQWIKTASGTGEIKSLDFVDTNYNQNIQKKSQKPPPPPPRPKSPEFSEPATNISEVPWPDLKSKGDFRIEVVEITLANRKEVRPDNFYVYRPDEESLNVYMGLIEGLTDYANEKGRELPVCLARLRSGFMLGVPDPEHPSEFTRAEFIRINKSNGNKLEIFYIDLGYTGNDVDPGQAFILPKKLCTIPRMAVRAKLHQIAPALARENFDPQSSKLMSDYIAKEGSKCILFSYTNGLAVIDVYVDKHHSQTLSELLVLEKLARFVDEEEEDSVGNWDPMLQEHQNELNVYGAKLDEFQLPGPKDEGPRVCRFFRETGKCRRGVACPYKHVTTPLPAPFVGTDLRPKFYAAYHEVKLPDHGGSVIVEVAVTASPGSFFCRMPFGIVDYTLTEDKIILEQMRLDKQENLKSLCEDLRLAYNARRRTGLPIAELTLGEVVAANLRNRWFRARVNNTNNYDSTVAVFLVDYGLQVNISPQDLRAIEQRFLHLPFQAFECVLHGVEPANRTWTTESAKDLSKFVENKYLIATFHHVGELSPRVELRDTHGTEAAKYLIKKGHAVETEGGHHRSNIPKISRFPG